MPQNGSRCESQQLALLRVALDCYNYELRDCGRLCVPAVGAVDQPGVDLLHRIQCQRVERPVAQIHVRPDRKAIDREHPEPCVVLRPGRVIGAVALLIGAAARQDSGIGVDHDDIAVFDPHRFGAVIDLIVLHPDQMGDAGDAGFFGNQLRDSGRLGGAMR